jgi:hypothetical protein
MKVQKQHNNKVSIKKHPHPQTPPKNRCSKPEFCKPVIDKTYTKVCKFVTALLHLLLSFLKKKATGGSLEKTGKDLYKENKNTVDCKLFTISILP